MSDRLWRAVVPPYRMLDPGLLLAETTLVDTLAELCAVLPDEKRASCLLNEALIRAGATPQLIGRDGEWRMVVAGHDPHAAAATALAVLVAAHGWRRLKRCVRCGRPFIDRTNGVSRRGCADHPSRPRGCRTAER
ncbi:hypothetical protein Q3W71_28020 [Micromonospora sp. C28SCA-DRY-2]|uniref:hypothetical protein n=1 Tax=Micromonospora sp. C28SCA-DRY-2 TaxID=3059522 RepID=UPI0026754FD9|nr:hypothetical protein [Micromonospora sp. C28SCA-DRY-2]MDO3705523.1 hypothetical protein [Micromonospora sp. C28SCA-DRY-2]